MDTAGERIGGIHLHVDASGTTRTDEFMSFVIDRLKSQNIETNITKIVEAVEGPQRIKLPEVYKHHTPGDGTKEEFGTLLTTGFKDRHETVQALNWMLPELQNYPGVVIEVERVFAIAQPDSSWTKTPEDRVNNFTKDEVGFSSIETHPIEVHYAIDMWGGDSKRLKRKPLELSQLLKDTEEKGLEVGGWFRFEIPGNVFAYRSNMFCEDNLKINDLTKHHQILVNCFNKYGYINRVRIFVEQILGIWKGGTMAAE